MYNIGEKKIRKNRKLKIFAKRISIVIIIYDYYTVKNTRTLLL